MKHEGPIRQDGFVFGAKVNRRSRIAVAAFTLIFAVIPIVSGPTAQSSFADRYVIQAKKTPSPIPSPQPKWPPVGFKAVDGVYAKIPTTKELVGLLSAKTTLQAIVKQCQQYACGAVVVAATNGCLWWEVNSTVFQLAPDNSKVKIGSLSTFDSGTAPKTQKTIFLISGANYDGGISVSGIKVLCHRNSVNQQKPGNVYRPVESPAA